MILTLTACLETPVGSATSGQIFEELGATLPTASTEDTEQTRWEVGIHRKVFFALCEKLQQCEEDR